MLGKLKVILLGTLAFSQSILNAQQLSAEEIFFRCYSQLTERKLSGYDARLDLLRRGTKTAADLCAEVLYSASFDSSGQIPDPTNPRKTEAKSVLRTMQNLHNTFFLVGEIEPISGSSLTKEIYDVETPGYYFTRALFQPGVLLSTVLTSNRHLRAIRPVAVPEGGAIGRFKRDANGKLPDRSKVAFGSSPALYPPRGELFGIREESTLPLGESSSKVHVDLADHFGGGVLGSNPYLFSVQARRQPINSDVELLQRGFATAVMNDFLCREFPVVELKDLSPNWIVQKTDKNDPLSFRQSQGCVQCHASMDRLASVARNISYQGLTQVDLEGAYFVSRTPSSVASESGWPSQKDGSFFKRPPRGRLFFRDSFNKLVDLPITDLTNLGVVLESQFDFYLCTASRYYRYFTGVKIKIVPGMFSDSQGTPRGDIFKTQKQRKHVENIFRLASDLRKDRKPAELIKTIFSLPEYQDSDFGVDVVEP